MSVMEMVPVVSEALKQQFREEGYFILPNVLPKEHLELLRAECSGFIDRMNKEMDEKGTDVVGINHRNKRYFVNNCWQQRPVLGEFIYSRLMADICRATLGPDAFLFWNQYVVKCADQGMKFSWHQDSGYVQHPHHKPYLTCWITLDDVTEENGTVHLLPYSRSGIRTWVQHIPDPATNDMIGYFGSDRGIPIVAPAGSIACFSSLVFHSSGANLTKNMRRIFLAQYASEIIMTEDRSRPWGASEPFLRDNEQVRTR
jgi:ectoine hydroxylase-related dioxygenase (phytanoyl-CoA dioxygenase family)